MNEITGCGHHGDGQQSKQNRSQAATGVRSDIPMDPEKDALVGAIRASTIYAAIVVRLPMSGEPLAAMTTFADFIRGLRMLDSFAGFAVIGPYAADAASGSGTNVLVCRILFRAIGSFSAASFKEISARAHSAIVEFYDDFVHVQAEFVARIDEFCDSALCIAAVGDGRDDSALAAYDFRSAPLNKCRKWLQDSSQVS